MDVGEPHVRRRGFFLHSVDTGEAEIGENENAEGFTVRTRTTRSQTTRQFASARRTSSQTPANEGLPAIRSGSVTGSRQRAHLPR
jgi:hypothetical protein